jgi:hypothetical protein
MQRVNGKEMIRSITSSKLAIDSKEYRTAERAANAEAKQF